MRLCKQLFSMDLEQYRGKRAPTTQNLISSVLRHSMAQTSNPKTLSNCLSFLWCGLFVQWYMLQLLKVAGCCTSETLKLRGLKCKQTFWHLIFTHIRNYVIICIHHMIFTCLLYINKIEYISIERYPIACTKWISFLWPSHVPREVATAACEPSKSAKADSLDSLVWVQPQSTSDLIFVQWNCILWSRKTTGYSCHNMPNMSWSKWTLLLILLSFQSLQVWTRNQIVCTGCKYSG